MASSTNPTFTRKFNDHTEWMLDQKIFNDIIARYGTPDIDLFASRLNHQLPRYVAWEPDSGAEAIDAFSIDWGGDVLLCFPSILPRWTMLTKNHARLRIGYFSSA